MDEQIVGFLTHIYVDVTPFREQLPKSNDGMWQSE
jgi:hypothetical protein